MKRKIEGRGRSIRTFKQSVLRLAVNILIDVKISPHWIIMFQLPIGIGIAFELPGIRGKIITYLRTVHFKDVRVMPVIIRKLSIGGKCPSIMLYAVMGG